MRLAGWLAFLAILLEGAGAVAAAEPPRPLRVVTFNLLHGGASSGLTGDAQRLELRLEMVAQELRALDPDVVALQEASTGRGRGNVAERLAQRLGLQYVHAPATSRVFPLRFLGSAVAWPSSAAFPSRRGRPGTCPAASAISIRACFFGPSCGRRGVRCRRSPPTPRAIRASTAASPSWSPPGGGRCRRS